mmetsp:Transcript_146719/g.470837  ORF Transcript_146719/g.470837 Transcript_146719/m.470837 type:complete len:207 (-) Transcript_146719:55-675(-)
MCLLPVVGGVISDLSKHRCIGADGTQTKGAIVDISLPTPDFPLADDQRTVEPTALNNFVRGALREPRWVVSNHPLHVLRVAEEHTFTQADGVDGHQGAILVVPFPHEVIRFVLCQAFDDASNKMQRPTDQRLWRWSRQGPKSSTGSGGSHEACHLAPADFRRLQLQARSERPDRRMIGKSRCSPCGAVPHTACGDGQHGDAGITET